MKFSKIALAAVLVWLSGTIANAVDLRQFLVTMRLPDSVNVTTETSEIGLRAGLGGVFTNAGVRVALRSARDGSHVDLTSPLAEVKQIHLIWKAAPGPHWLYLGDAWERAYGDLEWKTLDEKRIMPWYFLVNDGEYTAGCGVKTGPASLCSWTVSSSNITLEADVRCGGMGVLLGTRTLDACTITCRLSGTGETPFQSAQAFCRVMCPQPRLPAQPVYGFNDWYCSYGTNTADNYLLDASYIALLTPPFVNRPFAVIDAGWQAGGETDTTGPGPWDHPNPRFSRNLSMPQIAQSIRSLGERPGIWCRPLIASPNHPQSWRLSRDSQYLDFTVPAVRVYVHDMMAQMRRWGFDLIKHDFSTYDITGRWGSEMVEGFTADGWSFADRSRTTAEVIRDFYQEIRAGAGNGTLILGCNTIGHLSAGIFELQRIGDDTSGKEWDRTRKMGVNCLGFRAAQHGAFFAVDADCVGQVAADSVPWDKNRQWLDLLSHSGTPMFISFPRLSITPDVEQALRSALECAATPQPVAQPLDWLDHRTPTRWRFGTREAVYAW